MAIFTASKVASTAMARAGVQTITQTSNYTVVTNLTTADTIQMLKIPAGATIQEVIFSATASVGSTGSLSVGDGGATARFLASAAYTAAALNRLGVAAGHGYVYTAADTIDVTAVSIATPVTGAILTLTVIYTLQS